MKNNNKKKRQDKKKKEKKIALAKKNITLVDLWRKFKNSKAMLEHEKQKKENNLPSNISKAYTNHQRNISMLGYSIDLSAQSIELDNIIDSQKFFDQSSKSHMIKDIFDLISTRNYLQNNQDEDDQIDKQTKQIIINIWALPIIGNIKDLLALNKDSDGLSSYMKEDLEGLYKSKDNKTLSLGMFPVHTACSLSPQGIWNIAKSLHGGVWNDEGEIESEGLKTLRESLEDYLVTSSIDIEKILNSEDDFVGSAVLMLATRSVVDIGNEDNYDEDKISKWDNFKKAIQSWKESENRQHMLIAYPKKWSEGCIEAFMNNCDFEWGTSSRQNAIVDSVLSINKIKVQEHKDLSCTLHAYFNLEQKFGIAHTPPSAKLWVLDIALDNWILHRDIEISGYLFD